MTVNPENIVLLADDDPIFRSLVSSRLARLSCRVVEAQDGAEAWAKSRGHQFDLAIVDFEMPGLNGISLVQCLRGHPRTRHLPVVMCTSRSDGNAMREAIDAGITSFLTKPLNWSMFDSHVEHLLHIRASSNAAERERERLEQRLAANDAATRALLDELRLHLRRAQHARGPASDTAITAMHAAIDRFEAGVGPAADAPQQRAFGSVPA